MTRIASDIKAAARYEKVISRRTGIAKKFREGE
jgi:hypothetical protein